MAIRLRVYISVMIALLMMLFGVERLHSIYRMDTTSYQPKIRAEINNNKHLRYHISQDRQITDKENKHMMKHHQKKF